MDEAAPVRPVAMVIEDDAQTAYLLRYILQKEGYSVETAADGRVAQSLIANGPAPSLVTLDCLLPYADGFHLLEMMQERHGWKDVPVVMLSANSQKRDAARALDAGASAYIVKPFRVADFRATVRRLVNPCNPTPSSDERLTRFAPAYDHASVAAAMPLAA